MTQSTGSGPSGPTTPASTRGVAERVEALVSQMTLSEKVSQLASQWETVSDTGAEVAPDQNKLIAKASAWENVIRDGLGQLTRPFGSAPVEPAVGARTLARAQAEIMAANRWRIPAIVHEECLSGFEAWQATAFPVPLAWGASFDPELVESMAGYIGRTMRAAGVHQGLAPVLDVTRDYRWGRTEETIGEDPYLVGTIGTAYVKGLEDAGIVATLKHFAGYSASRAGRNLAPVAIGRRELADVILPPFEMAVRDGGARSVMHSYTEIDGVPSAADRGLLTDLLRDTWNFTGTVVSDYFGLKFLQTHHRVADSEPDAARLALSAGVDIELPWADCYGERLAEAVETGRISEKLVNRALRRVLWQKAELGLLDSDYDPLPHAVDALTFDDAAGQDVALRLARQSVVLLTNESGLLPVAPSASVALIGPLADDPMAMLGCYSFPVHVGNNHPDVDQGIDIPTLLAALRSQHGRNRVTHAPGCRTPADPDQSGFANAIQAASNADVCVVAVGDRSGLFGRGTSGEGCDTTDLRLPGVQEDLLIELLGTGTPVVVALFAGRPYALGAVVDRAAAVVQTFFPGQLGGRAVAEVLTGAVNPSGRLPVSIPRHPGGQPGTYLTSRLGGRTRVSASDPTPLFAFGAGTGYTTFEWDDARIVDPVARRIDDARAEWPVEGEATVSVAVRNTGDRAGTDVVQLYLHDAVAQVTRPVMRLVGYTRVELDAGQAAIVSFTVPADVTAFAGGDGRLIVEPGDVELRIARSSVDVHAALAFRLVGAERDVDHTRRLTSSASVRKLPPEAVPPQ